MNELKVKVNSAGRLIVNSNGVCGGYTGSKGIGVCGREISAISATATTMTIEAHVGNDTLTDAESGSVHTNLGAGGTIALTLPADPEGGTWFLFAVQENQQLRIDPGSNAIYQYVVFVPPEDLYIWADNIGECIMLVANEDNNWLAIGVTGTWTYE